MADQSGELFLCWDIYVAVVKDYISSSVKSLTAIFGLLVDQEELAHLRLIKGIVMQIEEALTNDRQCVLKISWKYRIGIIYDFAVI